MKNTILFLTCLLFVFATTNAQQMMNRENIKLLITSYITDALSLTPAEAEKFWPVYNLYINKIHESKFKLENEIFRQINAQGGIDNITEKQAQEFIEKTILLEENIIANQTKMLPSMTDGYDCYQNAMAERINGILKQEFLIHKCNNGKELKQLVKESINTYNNKRPHLSLNMKTPNFIHQKTCEDIFTGFD